MECDRIVCDAPVSRINRTDRVPLIWIVTTKSEPSRSSGTEALVGRYQLTGATSSGAGCTVTNPPTGGVMVKALTFLRCPSVDSWGNLQAGYTITGSAVTGTTVVDPRGYTTSVRSTPAATWSARPMLLGQTITTQLNAANQVASSTDQLGRVTKFEHDGQDCKGGFAGLDRPADGERTYNGGDAIGA